MSRNTTADDYVFVPFEQATDPPGGYLTHHKGQWWVVHPNKGICYYRPKSRHSRRGHAYPQCNSSEAISRRLLELAQGQEPNPLPGCEVRYIPSVFERLDVSEFRS